MPLLEDLLPLVFAEEEAVAELTNPLPPLQQRRRHRIVLRFHVTGFAWASVSRRSLVPFGVAAASTPGRVRNQALRMYVARADSVAARARGRSESDLLRVTADIDHAHLDDEHWIALLGAVLLED